MTHDVETPVGRYVGRGDNTGRNVLWWVPPGGAPWERLPNVRHRSVDGLVERLPLTRYATFSSRSRCRGRCSCTRRHASGTRRRADFRRISARIR